MAKKISPVAALKIDIWVKTAFVKSDEKQAGI